MSAQEHPANSGKMMMKRSSLISYVLAALGLLICLWSIWATGRMGLSRMAASYASARNLLPAADEAIKLSPADPEAHYLRASMLSDAGDTIESIREYERAVSFRPHDYVLWLSLAGARDEAGDTEGALQAFREAVRLAPAYAEPRWQLGNLLLRMNQREEAFKELRAAATSQPQLLPNFIDLVWNASSGDTTTLERVIRPETASWKLALARFLLKRGKTGEALALYRSTGEASSADRSSLLRELLAAKQFAAAHEVWKSGRAEGAEKSVGVEGGATLILDGSFESGAKVNEPGFGWQLITGQQTVRPSLDQGSPRGGSKSLLLDWAGGVDAATPVLSQLVLVEAGGRYRLSYSFRTSELSTGGPPVIVVADAGEKATELARSSTLPKETDRWKDETLEFAVGPDVRAVLIKVIRQNCGGGGPCPIFGKTWFDEFSLRKL